MPARRSLLPNLEKRLSSGLGGGGRLPHAALPPVCKGAGSSQGSRAALTCIIGARRAWIVPMISPASIACRYMLVVETRKPVPENGRFDPLYSVGIGVVSGGLGFGCAARGRGGQASARS